ncbi:response regulator transcription factor [Paenibacillus piri]|uniref:Response regulator n=1 Tax=Paenibacillus piri TaxID=2547395 RepID=A0A4R5KX42_9BACL|nr:response regulator [Paenibacillus piri]TDF99617.1 response regulator [Paenibacillus piri]
MNVLVVDDEPIIRQVLRTMMDWETHGMRWAGEAVDGEEAWETLRQGGIDLVVTDILMPRMDGLELVKRLKEADADVAVVVLSCLDDFAYVKEAMKQGASDYILKPTMEPEQLAATLIEAKLALLKRRDERRRHGELQEQLQQSKQAQRGIRLHKAWLSGQPDLELETELFAGDMSLSCWMIDVAPAGKRSIAGWDWPSAAAFVTLSGGRQLLLFQEDGELEGGGRAAALSDFLRGEGGLAAGEYCIAGLTRFHGAERLRQVPQELDVLRHAHFYRRKSGRCWITDADADQSRPFSLPSDGPLPQEEKQNLLRAIAGRNTEAAAYWAEQLVERIRRLEPPVEQVYSFLYELLGSAAAFAGQHGDAPEMDEFERKYVALDAVMAHLQLEPLGRWLTDAIQDLSERLTGTGGILQSSRNPFIRKAVAYMQRNYHLQLSTSDIADYVKLSRSYLSDLYGKEIGESLSESLTRIRIQAAKRLLAAGDLKVYEIAGAVGFGDAKSFAKAFKKAVGCTPKEYEEQNK